MIDGILPGFATIALNPIPRNSLSIQRQCVPVSNTTGHERSNFANASSNPAFVVAHVVSTTMRLSPPSAFVITQIFVVRSLTSAPIVVQYSMSAPPWVFVVLVFAPPTMDECVSKSIIAEPGRGWPCPWREDLRTCQRARCASKRKRACWHVCKSYFLTLSVVKEQSLSESLVRLEKNCSHYIFVAKFENR